VPWDANGVYSNEVSIFSGLSMKHRRVKTFHQFPILTVGINRIKTKAELSDSNKAKLYLVERS
jgi:hypothetical protein